MFALEKLSDLTRLRLRLQHLSVYLEQINFDNMGLEDFEKELAASQAKENRSRDKHHRSKVCIPLRTATINANQLLPG